MYKRESETQNNLVEKLKNGWYLKKNLVTFLWVVIDEISGTTIRVGRRTAESLVASKIIKRQSIKSDHETYMLNGE